MEIHGRKIFFLRTIKNCIKIGKFPKIKGEKKIES